MKRPPGRPPLDTNDPSVEVCVTLPSKKYDDLYKRARIERTTVPELIRRKLDDTTQPVKIGKIDSFATALHAG